uniref:Uncharacterized protein n=1 Tax=Picea glauca TaxID=3330 RepID=A0A124GNX0_PICGL|nr:hypothetical protein ABT39_MTgene3377 [Picea glauca]
MHIYVLKGDSNLVRMPLPEVALRSRFSLPALELSMPVGERVSAEEGPLKLCCCCATSYLCC